MKIPYFDPLKSYEENYKNGPFGDFGDGKKLKQTENPKYKISSSK